WTRASSRDAPHHHPPMLKQLLRLQILKKIIEELNDLETEVNCRKRQKQEEETTEKKKKCCFGTKDAEGNNEHTIFVTGFDNSGSRDEIRSALAKHFSSCGELTRVFVHIECETGVSRGYAFY
ncbi:unnamed protein product, partial [Brassica napus]